MLPPLSIINLILLLILLHLKIVIIIIIMMADTKPQNFPSTLSPTPPSIPNPPFHRLLLLIRFVASFRPLMEEYLGHESSI